MTADPRAVKMLAAWADLLTIPPVCPVGIHLFESGGGNLDAIGDGGQSFGGLQMHAPVWGYPGGQWMGLDGLARSIAALTPQWQRAARPLLYEWERYTWEQQVAAFARFWITAQIADPDAVNAHAEAALRMGYDALALITSEPTTDHKVNTMTGNLDLFRKRAAWAFTWTPGTQMEQDGAAIAATLSRFGIGALWQEAFYGLTWQGEIDRRKNGGAYGSPQSLPEFRALGERLAADDIGLVPVVVPLGLAGEAELHAEVARACGAVVVDIEVDNSGDWWPARQIEQVSIYARALREACGPDVVIAWEPDGRIADPGRPDEWGQIVTLAAPYVDVWSPQLYSGWTAYGIGQRAIEADLARFARFAELGPACPTLYLSESLNEPAALWREFGSRALGVCGFRFGAMGAEALTLLGSLALAEAPAPEPEIDPRIMAAINGLTAIEAGLLDLSERAQVQAASVRALRDTLAA